MINPSPHPNPGEAPPGTSLHPESGTEYKTENHPQCLQFFFKNKNPSQNTELPMSNQPSV